MLRPMTSCVSALSGIVANSHQAIYLVSSAPSKIPYGGFSPVRLQAGCQQRPSPPNGFDAATVEVSSVRVLFRSRASARRHSRLLTPHTCPVALGSASGSAVRRPHRLLWPHPSFCPAPPVSFYFLRTSRDAEGPHFYLPELDDVPPSLLRWPQGELANPDPWLGLHPLGIGSATIFDPHTGLRVVALTKLQRSLYAAARHLARPAPDGTFTIELTCPESPRRRSIITTGTFAASLTGLSPAALSALWAARPVKPGKAW